MQNKSRDDPFAPAGALPGIVDVGTLNRLARNALESVLSLLWVGGEISNLTRASSGHLYFTLKDAHAQVRCAMWRNRAQLLSFRPDNGMRVEARALVTLYEARGDYQLNVETLRPAGIGDLAEAFRRLKDKLAGEGLFDPARRRPLPTYPRALGIVTSPAAAALRDVLATLRRRAPGLPAVLYPAAVQGSDAPRQLRAALENAGRRATRDGIDLILLVRGGGSLEDLWAFNDEALARALAACPVPVVSGIGHETDFTIADFAADLRAPTPTAAAELASAGYFGARDTLASAAQRMRQAIDRQLAALAQRIDHCALRLVHPREHLRRTRDELARHEQGLRQAMTIHLGEFARRLSRLELRLHAQRPAPAVLRVRLDSLGERLERASRALCMARRQRLDALAASLRHLDPQAVLARGYSIVRDAAGNILRSATDIQPGDALEIKLADGRIDATAKAARADQHDTR
ncbi:MAG: exodeoxyribonuclease VII large subunit [Azoarcus sp.]|jgi:exodeoxyribonuclease VII large subunit|nr:exodeoxyribonuclease VII large subunit [Azoarcus sp.]